MNQKDPEDPTDHGGKDVLQSPRQLEHDDHNRDRDMHNPAEGCPSSKESVSARRDTWYIWFACPEKSRMREAFMESLDQNPHHPAKGCTNGHGRHEDAGWNLAAVGDDDQKGSHHGRKCQGQRHRPPVLGPVMTQSHIDWAAGVSNSLAKTFVIIISLAFAE